MLPRRVAVFIDGSNFYFKLKTLGFQHLSQFQYRNFVEWLAGYRSLVSAQYYIGVVRAKPNDQKGRKMRFQQRQFFNYLLETQKFIIKKGYLMQSGNLYH